MTNLTAISPFKAKIFKERFDEWQEALERKEFKVNTDKTETMVCRGRQRKRWIDVEKYNMEDLRVDLMDVENEAEWRQRTHVADPSPEGFKPA